MTVNCDAREYGAQESKQLRFKSCAVCGIEQSVSETRPIANILDKIKASVLPKQYKKITRLVYVNFYISFNSISNLIDCQ